MDDPTGELRRQRDLIAAHLRWLDDQIARSQGTSPPPPVAAPPSPSAVPLAPLPFASAAGPIAVPTQAAASGEPATLPEIALPEIDPGSVRNEVRRGCFIYVIIATVLLGASIAVAVWIGGQ
jgi:hypothetical protein